MTVDTFKEMVQLVDVATHYQSHYAEELTYTCLLYTSWILQTAKD